MPFYMVVTQDGSVADGLKAKIAEEITRIHATVMKVPRSFIRVVFLSSERLRIYGWSRGSDRCAELCPAERAYRRRKGRYAEAIVGVFRDLTGLATDQIAISLEEIPSTNAMEMGQIMPAVGHE